VSSNASRPQCPDEVRPSFKRSNAAKGDSARGGTDRTDIPKEDGKPEAGRSQSSCLARQATRMS
jgi:hypothetical protein